MELDTFRESFDTLFLEELKNLLDCTKDRFHNPHIHEAISHVYILAQNGKRIRPYVLSLAYGARKKSDLLRIKNQLIGIELLHLFALIHDDIMDEAPTRHGVRTVHTFIEKKYNSLSRKKDQGNYEAILIGDLIFSYAYSIFLKKCPDEIAHIFQDLIEEVIAGQLIDIRIPYEKNVSKDLIYERMLLKTARYSFARPMQIGALLASKDKKGTQSMYNFGEILGILFQITDDIIDIESEKKDLKKTPLQDLYNGQETFLTYTMKELNPLYYSRLNKYSRKSLSAEEVRIVKNIFNESGTLLKAREEIEFLKTKAQKYISQLEDTDIWSQLLEKIINRKS